MNAPPWEGPLEGPAASKRACEAPAAPAARSVQEEEAEEAELTPHARGLALHVLGKAVEASEQCRTHTVVEALLHQVRYHIGVAQSLDLNPRSDLHPRRDHPKMVTTLVW